MRLAGKADHQSHDSNMRRCIHSANQCPRSSTPLQVFLPAEAATALAAPAAAMHMLSTELLVYRRTIDQVSNSGYSCRQPCAVEHDC